MILPQAGCNHLRQISTGIYAKEASTAGTPYRFFLPLLFLDSALGAVADAAEDSGAAGLFSGADSVFISGAVFATASPAPSAPACSASLALAMSSCLWISSALDTGITASSSRASTLPLRDLPSRASWAIFSSMAFLISLSGITSVFFLDGRGFTLKRRKAGSVMGGR